MICPDVWKFNPPNTSISYKLNPLTEEFQKTLNCQISSHSFNKLVSVVIPDINIVPENIKNIFADSDHYILHNVNLSEFIERPFVEGFINRGSLHGISVNTRIDVDDCIAITPCKHLYLSLNKEIFQSLGLEGKLSFFSRKSQDRYKIFEYNVPCFLYDPLCEELFIEVPKMIELIKKRLKPGSSMGEFLSQVNVAVSLTEIIISSNLKKLDFDSMPKMIRHLFYNKLSSLTGLEYLNLGSLSGGWKTGDMEPTVLNGIVGMSNLQYFCFNYDCTNDILLALLESCPQLKTIDITSSKSITNDSVNIIIRFKHLKTVQLYRTGVSIEGYVKLLLNIPNLEDVGRYDEIGRCLEYIVDNYKDKQKFGLKRFTSRFVTTRFLQILAENCPDIYFVSLFHNVLLCDLIMLVGINNLSDLRLLSCDFFADQVRNVLAVKGCNLTHLHLEHVDEIDMNALMYISQFCPDLKALTFYNCEMIPSTSLFIKKPTIPPFMNLERLTLVAQCDGRHLEFLLSSCFKIKFIKIGTMVPTDDHMFEKVLSLNPMGHLEELSVSSSAGLSIAIVYKLVEVCPNLMVLNELEGWELVQEMELETFRLFIETNNLDLNIASKRFQSE